MPAVRNNQLLLEVSIEKVNVGSISAETDSSKVLKDIDVLIHCAARAHIMNDSADDPLEEFRG